MSEKSKIILKSKVHASMDSKIIKSKYRIVIFKKDGKWMLAPEQSFDGEFNEYSGLPAWELESLQKEYPEKLYIDMGQKWLIHQLIPAIREAQIISNIHNAFSTHTPTKLEIEGHWDSYFGHIVEVDDVSVSIEYHDCVDTVNFKDITDVL